MGLPDQVKERNDDSPEAIEASRQKRLAALKATFGLWKNRADVPQDGVEYQEGLRSEWR